MSDCRPTLDPNMQGRLTVRMEMFEVYEKTSNGMRLLLVTSDFHYAHRCAEDGDVVVQRSWVREGADE